MLLDEGGIILGLVPDVSTCEFTLELSAGIVHDGAGGTRSVGLASKAGCSTMVRAVFLDRRANDFVPGWDG